MARLQAAVLCDAAKVDQGGLVSMLGAFVDTITASAGPPIRHAFQLACRFYLDPADVGEQHRLEVTVECVEADEGQVTPPGPLVAITGVFAVEGLGDADPRISGGAPIVLPLLVEFPGTGLYHATLKLDGDLLWTAPILIKLAG